MIDSYRGAVYPWHCDHMGHMNVMWYAGKFDESTWILLSTLGLTPSYMRDNHRAMVAVHQEISYKKELHAGDLVAVRSGVLEAKEKSLRFVHEMRNGVTGDIASLTVITGVHVDAELRRACPFPDEIRRQIEANVVNYELNWR